MDALKNMYTQEWIEEFSAKVRQEYPGFDAERFREGVFDEEWNGRELKKRIRHITTVLGSLLPEDFEEAVGILGRLADENSGFQYQILPDFVEVFGQAFWNVSNRALKRFTRSSSSEFAVRPFIEMDQDRMLGTMLEWAKDEDEHVRRLASEGCRPRLPWAPPLRRLKADPTPVLPILEQLKTDDSEYVRRSVANNLNDISKDHPELVLRIAEDWLGQDPRTDRIVKHACRTLLKKGQPDALRLFGFVGGGDGDGDGGAMDWVSVEELSVSPTAIRLGEEIRFSFRLIAREPASFRLQFGVDYVKANGKTSRKLFHLSEKKDFKGVQTVERRLSFKDFTTRKHYPGDHGLSILINGAQVAECSFRVEPEKG